LIVQYEKKNILFFPFSFHTPLPHPGERNLRRPHHHICKLIKCGYVGTGTVKEVLDPESHGSALILVGWTRIQEGKTDPQKFEKSKEIIAGSLFWRLKASPVLGRPLWRPRHK
jgi:hypothetical protein